MSSPISRCPRCDALRQQALIIRVPSELAAWQCPECSVAWAPVTFFDALVAPHPPPVESFGLPKPCPCPAGGPFELVQRSSTDHTWTWLCAGCGTGQDAKIFRTALGS